MSADDHDDRKSKIDEHKHDQLNKQKEGKGHWKKELSSNSEAAVRLLPLSSGCLQDWCLVEYVEGNDQS